MQWENIDPAKWADALLIVILGLLSAFGLGKVRRGSNSPQPKDDVLEVAGAIVSDKAVTRMVASMDALATAINTDVRAKTALTDALTANSRALDRNSETADDMLDGINDTTHQMERLRDEMFRAQIGKS